MFCKYCGQKNQEHAKFCQNCGGKLEEQITPSPAVNQTTPAATVSIPQKNDNKLILIIAVIIGICAIALPIIFMNKNNSEEKNDNKKEDTQVDNPTTPNIDTSVNNDKVQYGGYSFDIPYEYNKMEYDGNLAVYPNDSSWMIMFMFSESSFYELKNNTSLFDAMMEAEYDNVKSVLKNHQGVEYILTSVTAEGDDMQIIITDAGNNKVLMTLIMPTSPSVTLEELFNLAFPIIMSVK